MINKQATNMQFATVTMLTLFLVLLLLNTCHNFIHDKQGMVLYENSMTDYGDEEILDDYTIWSMENCFYKNPKECKSSYDVKILEEDYNTWKTNNCSEYSNTECFRLWSNLGE